MKNVDVSIKNKFQECFPFSYSFPLKSIEEGNFKHPQKAKNFVRNYQQATNFKFNLSIYAAVSEHESLLVTESSSSSELCSCWRYWY